MKIPKKMTHGVILTLSTLIWLLAVLPPAYALDITEVMVTDVTPASFCVVWLTSEQGSGEITLYQDPDGLYPVSSYSIIDTPCTDETLFSQAAQKGILKIKVTDLSQDITYYFRLAITSTEDPNITAVYPYDDTLFPVTTEQEARISQNEAGQDQDIRLQSNILMADFYLEDKITPADNTLVIAQIEGASYSLSAFVGEGTTTPLCIIDLHNLFCASQHTTIEPVPGSGILFYNYKGTEQTAIRRFFLPAVLPEDEPIFPVGITQEINLSQGLNYISFQVDPQNSEDIHAVLNGKYTEIWTYENSAWIDLIHDTTHIFRPNQGYLITTTESLLIRATGGWRMDQVPLNEGLNIVGYRAETPIPIEQAMAPLWENTHASRDTQRACGNPMIPPFPRL